MIKDNEKGVTLIELIISIAVSSIVLVLILGIFFTGIKIYKANDDNTEIIQQGNSIMDFMTSIIMSSSRIEDIENQERSSYYESNNKIWLGKIKLNDINLENKERHIFSIQEDPKVEGCSIRYGKIGEPTIEVGNYIKTIYTEPLPEKSSYSNAKGIRLTIEMRKGKSTISLSKSMYFRNH